MTAMVLPLPQPLFGCSAPRPKHRRSRLFPVDVDSGPTFPTRRAVPGSTHRARDPQTLRETVDPPASE